MITQLKIRLKDFINWFTIQSKYQHLMDYPDNAIEDYLKYCKEKLNNISRHMSKLLRHDPEDLSIDKEGYVLVEDLLNKKGINKEELDWIVETNGKKRFAYNSDKTKIRASQGHSKGLKVKIDMPKSDRIEILYHGTATKYVESIMKSGIKSQGRHHVHLSKDTKTAINVGGRKDKKDITILQIDSARMRGDGVKIWISANGVYLTDYIDPKYISYE